MISDSPPLIGNHKLNVYLKTIREICGIDKPIFSHVARHTYATRCLLPYWRTYFFKEGDQKVKITL